MARVVLVRHAQSEANRDRMSLGRADSPLTAVGERQAAALGSALAAERVRRVVASPLSRARETAAAIAQQHRVAVEADERLIEMDVGALDGLSFAQAREQHGDFLQEWIAGDAASLPMPGGESMTDVALRAWPALAELLAVDAEPGDEEEGVTVVVSHNFVIKALLCRALEFDLRAWRRFEVDLASRSTLARRRGLVALYALNDTSHLGPALRG